MKTSYNPYIKEEGKKVFAPSFCVYFDILGFSDKISNIESDGLNYFNDYLKTLDNILKYLTKHNNYGDDNKHKRFELKIFTDNFVIGFPVNNDGETEFGEIFDVLSYIQYEFIKNNIFIKGAISFSNLYMDKNIVIGTALIDAYQLEEKYSIYPRIILSKEVSEKVNQYINYFAEKKGCPENKRCLIDKDGYYFINYLDFLMEHYIDNDDNEMYIEIENELLLHKVKILEQLELYFKNDRIFEKFVWLANYHNYFCKNFLNKKLYNLKNLIIHERNFKSITRIIKI